MATTLYPRITKKKAVPQELPDSFRVISIDAELKHQPLLAYQPLPDIIPRPKESREYPTDDRYHKPHPYDCGFLRHNPRWINEPICTVHTRTLKGPSDYRPSAQFFYDEVIPTKTGKSVFMKDYRRDLVSSKRLGRYGSSPNSGAATGIVPLTELDVCRQGNPVVKEDISYEQIYDSRNDPNYPVRTKRHGSFVWKYPKPGTRATATTVTSKGDGANQNTEQESSDGIL